MSQPARVCAPIRLGLELAPLGAPERSQGTVKTLSVAEVATAAEAAGIGTLWLASSPTGGLEPGPFAGWAAAATTTIGIGLVERPSLGRHPSVLVRDVTTLDLLSAGRAAVAILQEASDEAAERLSEATSLVHALLTRTEITVAGRFYEVAELTTRPRPLHSDGPPILAGVLEAPDALRGAEAMVLSAGAAGYLIDGSPGHVHGSRLRLDRTADGARSVLIWRGELARDPSEATEQVEALLEAGADGLMMRLGPSSAPGGGVPRAGLDVALQVAQSVAWRLSAG